MRNFSLEKTSDGSFTLQDGEYREAMHSTSGAYQEALLKHVYPSRILEKIGKPLFILDIGFGVGYNILALLMELERNRNDQPVTIHSFEMNKDYSEFLDQIAFHDDRDRMFPVCKTVYRDGRYQFQNLSIEIHFGDARACIKDFSGMQFSAVFHDPYSPSKNPELWTLQFFNELYKIMSPEGILTTYSSAPQVRGALWASGFNIGRGPAVGNKKEGTLAGKQRITNEMSGQEIHDLLKDYKSTPYLDYSFQDTRKEILERRLAMMRNKRQSISSSSSSTDLSD